MKPAVTGEATWGNWGDRAPLDQYYFFCQVLHLILALVMCRYICKIRQMVFIDELLVNGTTVR